MTRFLIIIAVFFISIQAKSFNYIETLYSPKVITIAIDESGKISIGRDIFTTEQLTEELQIRLWKSYLGTGKMYDGVHLEIAAGARTDIISSVKKAIKEAQGKALIDVCLQKHKKLFDDLSSRQQEKIRMQFPVLFQQAY